MTNELKKRDCDVNIKLTPLGINVLSVEFDIQGDHWEFTPSSVMGRQFGDFVSALYKLFDEDGDDHPEWPAYDYVADENNIIHAVTATVSWDEERTDAEIFLSRNVEDETDFETEEVYIEFRRPDELLSSYTVKTKDLCYAVAKACTQVIKEYGFWGYSRTTEYDSFKIHQLLFIKSLALLNFEARELFPLDKHGFVKRSSFENELELLLFDM